MSNPKYEMYFQNHYRMMCRKTRQKYENLILNIIRYTTRRQKSRWNGNLQ